MDYYSGSFAIMFSMMLISRVGSELLWRFRVESSFIDLHIKTFHLSFYFFTFLIDLRSARNRIRQDVRIIEREH